MIVYYLELVLHLRSGINGKSRQPFSPQKESPNTTSEKGRSEVNQNCSLIRVSSFGYLYQTTYY